MKWFFSDDQKRWFLAVFLLGGFHYLSSYSFRSECSAGYRMGVGFPKSWRHLCALDIRYQPSMACELASI